jgi:hypothetical protein
MNHKSELEVKLEAEARRLRSLEEQRAKDAANTGALKKSFAEEVSELKKEKVGAVKTFIQLTLDLFDCVTIAFRNHSVSSIYSLFKKHFGNL